MEALRDFGWMLSSCKPRAIDCKLVSAWRIFTDACYEPTSASWKCGIGGLLFDSVGSCFSFCLSDSHLEALGANSKGNIIMEAEFLALICVLQVWANLIRNAPVAAFVDSNSCRDIIISAKGRNKTVKCPLQHFLKLEHDCGIITWVARVPSPSNIANEPSKPPHSSKFEVVFSFLGRRVQMPRCGLRRGGWFSGQYGLCSFA